MAVRGSQILMAEHELGEGVDSREQPTLFAPRLDATDAHLHEEPIEASVPELLQRVARCDDGSAREHELGLLGRDTRFWCKARGPQYCKQQDSLQRPVRAVHLKA